MDDGGLMTPSEVSAAFAVSTKTVTRWADAGRLTVIRTPGGHRRFRRKEVVALLDLEPAPPADMLPPPSRESWRLGARKATVGKAAEPAADFLSPREAANLLGISINSLRKWADFGVLTVEVPLPGSSRYRRCYRRSQVEELLTDGITGVLPNGDAYLFNQKHGPEARAIVIDLRERVSTDVDADDDRMSPESRAAIEIIMEAVLPLTDAQRTWVSEQIASTVPHE